MFSYLVYSRDTVVYIRVRKTFTRLLYLDERCGLGHQENITPLLYRKTGFAGVYLIFLFLSKTDIVGMCKNCLAKAVVMSVLF